MVDDDREAVAAEAWQPDAPAPGRQVQLAFTDGFADDPVIVRVDGTVAAEVAAVVAKMMAKKQEDRYQSASELAAALLPFCGKETASWVAVEPLPTDPVAPVSSKSSVGNGPAPTRVV